MRGGLNIAAKTRKLDVDNRLPLKLYYRTAENLLKQASIYREERNIIDLYILLLRFSSLVSETIPDHRDYRLYVGEKARYITRLLEVVSELELLKPEVQKQVDQINNPYSKSSSSSSNFFSSDLSAPPSAPYARNQFYGNANYDKVGPGWSFYNNLIPWQSFSLSTLNIPRPRDETVSRHSFLASSSNQNRREHQQVRVQYPSYIDTSPIEIPRFVNLITSWSLPSQPAVVSTPAVSLDTVGEPALWPDSGSVGPTEIVNIIRQPSPPPILAAVQALQEGLNSHDHVHPQPHPSDVADPRPGPPQVSDDAFTQSKGPKSLHISTKMMDDFMQRAKANTLRNLETCGVLAGSLKKGTFYVSTLIIPKQEATSDSCQTVNEEEIFDTQDQRGLFQLGWIHTHPSQTCFMSSIDLHTHYSYQIMLQEAIAIVMAPTDPSRKYGIFRLADPGGVKVLQQCQRRGFHPHEEPPDGGPIYEHCSHVLMNPGLPFEVLDLR
ncbi:unnamed protein product [Sphagnum jensenii]|uniref:MPN domain-containing protein n=1 Tax=Sphagnum jensenii TaxID=128206 RepID=A0ABP0WQX7_9BRYO